MAGETRFGRHQWHSRLEHNVFRSWTARRYIVTSCLRCGAWKSDNQVTNGCPRNPLREVSDGE